MVVDPAYLGASPDRILLEDTGSLQKPLKLIVYTQQQI